MITIVQIEQAINYWRNTRPATGAERSLSREVNTLADIYAHLIAQKLPGIELGSMNESQKQAFQGFLDAQSPQCEEPEEDESDTPTP